MNNPNAYSQSLNCLTRINLAKYKEAPVPEGDGYVRVRLPRRRNGELFAVADQLLGASRIRVMCEDGKSRMGRIPGKLKKRMWIREGDLVVVKPWDFQKEKADIVYRYTKTQSSYLKRKRMIPHSIDVF
ncbi:MAG: translation initiation factor eIF-1A [Thermoplasmata archaeon]|nr:translation initiation factor eIF-1A [Thermoplasmata archaeon]